MTWRSAHEADVLTRIGNSGGLLGFVNLLSLCKCFSVGACQVFEMKRLAEGSLIGILVGTPNPYTILLEP